MAKNLAGMALFAFSTFAGCSNQINIDLLREKSNSNIRDEDSGLKRALVKECGVNKIAEELSFWKYFEEPENERFSNCSLRSLNYSKEMGGGECGDYAIAAAAISSSKFSYEPLVLVIPPHLARVQIAENLFLTITQSGHAVNLLVDKENNRYGLIGVNEEDRICPQYATLEELFQNWEYTKRIVQPEIKYYILNFEGIDLKNYDGNLCLHESVKEEFIRMDKGDFFLVDNPSFSQQY